jgi:restriction endonuclease S subunit
MSPVNEAKYEALLRGLEITILNLQSFNTDNTDFRLDSEYFSKENIRLLNILCSNGYRLISDFSEVTDGIHSSIDYSEDSGINLISATSPKNNVFDLSRQAFISKKSHFENSRTALRENDIILSTVGTIGNCAVVTRSILPANSDRHVGIIRVDSTMSPFYVSTFLLSKYGKFQTLRESTGNVQLNLFIYKIKSLKIATASTLFQFAIEKIIKQSHSILEKSKNTYLKAEQTLLQELSLFGWKPKDNNKTVKKISESFGISGRLDAEYYQPKYDEIEKAIIKCTKCSLLGNILLEIDTGEYSSAYYYNDEMPGLTFYIRSTNIKYGKIDIDENYFVKKKEFCRIAKKGQIVTARVGSLGVFGEIRSEMDGAVYSDNVLCFSLPKNFIPSVYVLLFNSSFYFELIDRLARGSVQQRLNQETLKDLIIPIIDYSRQEKISTLIEKSFNLREQSEQLLETAKRAVEVAIESNEKKAIEFIASESCGSV